MGERLMSVSRAVILTEKFGKLFPSVCLIITYYIAYYKYCVMPAFSSFISYSKSP